MVHKMDDNFSAIQYLSNRFLKQFSEGPYLFIYLFELRIVTQ